MRTEHMEQVVRWANFVRDNPELKLSKFVFRKGNFVFYREYVNIQKVRYETADFSQKNVIQAFKLKFLSVY